VDLQLYLRFRRPFSNGVPLLTVLRTVHFSNIVVTMTTICSLAICEPAHSSVEIQLNLARMWSDGGQRRDLLASAASASLYRKLPSACRGLAAARCPWPWLCQPGSPIAGVLPSPTGWVAPEQNSVASCQSPAMLSTPMPVILPSMSKPNSELAASPRGKTSFTR
jgi:hypothetical protein